MKTIELHTGKHPLKLDNLVHIQEALVELSEAIGKGFGELGVDKFIIWGCEFTQPSGPNSLAWTAGACYKDGEFLSIAAGSTTKTSLQGFKLVVSDTYLAIDPQLYNGVTPENVHRVRVGTFQGATLILPYVDLYALTPSERRLKDILFPNYSSYSSGSAGWSASHDVASPVWSVTTQTNKYRVERNQMDFSIRILVSSLSDAAQQLSLNIPDGWEADGDFSSVATANGSIVCNIKVYEGGTTIQVNTVTGDLPSGACEVYGQIRFQVRTP